MRQRNNIIAVLVILGLLAYIGSSAPADTDTNYESSPPVVDSAEAAALQREKARRAAQAEEAVQELVNSGLVERLDREMHDAYVNPYLWHMLNIDQKEGVAIILARWFDSGTQYAYIYDYQSGKKLAEYDAWGFEVE